MIVDVRHPTEYNGTSPKPVSKGHIPGAVNVNWESLITATGALKSKEDLKKIFAAKGITSGKTIVLYCATSVRAGIESVALKGILGFPNVKVYNGAYNEWDALGYKFEK